MLMILIVSIFRSTWYAQT